MDSPLASMFNKFTSAKQVLVMENKQILDILMRALAMGKPEKQDLLLFSDSTG